MIACVRVAIVSAALSGVALAQAGTVRMSEVGLRNRAKETAMPVYPKASVDSKAAGVAVATFTTDATGKIAQVTVLQAPDAAISDAVRDALMKWRFEPVIVGRENQPRALQSIVTFYFVLKGGVGRVLNPEEMPGGPPADPRSRASQPHAGASRPGTAPASAPAVISHDAANARAIDETELRALESKKDAIVVDTRVREAFKRRHRDGAVNIPVDELRVRAGIELPAAKLVVVECIEQDQGRCGMAASVLESLKFSRIARLIEK